MSEGTQSHSLDKESLTALALHALWSKDFVAAEHICHMILRALPSDPNALSIYGYLTHIAGKSEEGAAILKEVLQKHKNCIWGGYLLGVIYQELGKVDYAVQSFRIVLEMFPLFPAAHEHLKTLLMPGRDYLAVLEQLHRELKPQTYLEIGVSFGRSLALARCSKCIIGVDPVKSDQLKDELVNVKFFEMTSDAFFQEVNIKEHLGNQALELGFIDGMHRFEFALRDFFNMERFCHPSSVIVIHDCLPVDKISASRERKSGFWSGDVWKLIQIFAQYREDLCIKLIRTAPSGLAVITRLNPQSTVLSENYDDIFKQYIDFPYNARRCFDQFKDRLISSDEQAIADLVASLKQG